MSEKLNVGILVVLYSDGYCNSLIIIMTSPKTDPSKLTANFAMLLNFCIMQVLTAFPWLQNLNDSQQNKIVFINAIVPLNIKY